MDNRFLEERENEDMSALVNVANLYYNCDMTQSQIANRLYTSRSKISRMLKRAKELGLVEIHIREPWNRVIDAEQELAQKFNLGHVRVIDMKQAEQKQVYSVLADITAYYIDSIIDEKTILGMSWGYTLYNTVAAIKTSKNLPLTVVTIMGVANISKSERDSLDLSKQFAHAYGGKYYSIYAPLFVKSKSLKKELVQEPKIEEVISVAKKANIILTSVGSIEYKSWADYLKQEELKGLERVGCVGHIGGHFFDIHGKELSTTYRERTIGIDFEDIKKTNNVVCVACKKEKATALLGALHSGSLNTLIIDLDLAKKVIELQKDYERSYGK